MDLDRIENIELMGERIMELFFQRKVLGDVTKLELSVEKDTELDKFSLNMLKRNQPDCFVPMDIVQYDARNYLQYNIAGKQTLKDRISVPLHRIEVTAILDSILKAFEEAEAYMLLTNNLYLELNYIFVNENNKCSLLYLPFCQETTSQLLPFLNVLLEQVQPDNSEKDNYIYNLLNAFSRGAIKKPEDLRELLHKRSIDTKEEKREMLVSKKEEKPVDIVKEEKPEEKIITVKEKPSGIPINIPGMTSYAKAEKKTSEKEKKASKKENKKKLEFSFPSPKGILNRNSQREERNVLVEEIKVEECSSRGRNV